MPDKVALAGVSAMHVITSGLKYAGLWAFGSFVWFGLPLMGFAALIGIEPPVRFGLLAGPALFSTFLFAEWIEGHLPCMN